MMKTNISPFLFLGAVLVATLAPNAFAQDTKPYASTPLSMEWTILVSVTAKVEAVGLAKREGNLKGPLGNVVTFVVDERVRRFNEVRVGDEVTTEY